MATQGQPRQTTRRLKTNKPAARPAPAPAAQKEGGLSQNYILKRVRLMFPSLHKTRRNNLIKERVVMEYTTAVIVEYDHPQTDDLLNTIEDLNTRSFSEATFANYEVGSFFKECIKPKDVSTFGDDCEFFFNCKASEDQPPLLIDASRATLTEVDALSNGALVNIMLNLYTYNQAGNRGCTAYVKGVQVLEPGNRMVSASMFDDETAEFGENGLGDHNYTDTVTTVAQVVEDDFIEEEQLDDPDNFIED